MSRISSREEALFADALALPPAGRGAFLAKECGANVDLLAHLVALVAAHEGPDSLTPPDFSAAKSFLGDAASGQMSAAALVKTEEKPGDVIGRYKLLQKIGEGGCGVVWAAEQREPVKRRVALKIIKLGMDTQQVIARFEAERQALAMMDHPNIAKMLDAGATATGRPYFVMELVRGIPITAYCDENNLTTAQRLELLIKVCHAIQHAHQKGIIHRDIKPSNVLITLHDGEPVPKVIDFGIAKATQQELTEKTIYTRFQQFIGTPAYMSPEQAEMSGLDIDTRSDIYSLGVLLYELVTGRTPFDAKDLVRQGVDEIRRTIREKEPPRPSTRIQTLHNEELTDTARRRSTDPRKLVAAVRGDLDWIVMKCLEKDRTRRYETANGVAMDLQRLLRNELVVARPPSSVYRFQKLVRRHRIGFAASAAAAASILVGLALATRALVREKAANLRAQSARELAEVGRVKSEELLSFVFTDFAEQLDAFGHSPVLRQVSEKVVAYYESLPAGLQTRDTRASHALALAGVGALGWSAVDTSAEGNYGQLDARVRLQRAMTMVRELEATGPLTDAMRIAYAGVCSALALQCFSEARFTDALRLNEIATEKLQPVLVNNTWKAAAQRQLVKLTALKGFNQMWIGRARDAVQTLEHAIELAAAADRLPGAHRPALMMASIKPYLAEALWNAGDRQRARAVNADAFVRLSEFIAQEPMLVRARISLAWTARNRARQARAQWDFPEFARALRDAQIEYAELLKLDPKSWEYRGMLAHFWGAVAGQFGFEWLMNNFAAAETAAQRGVELWEVAWAPLDSRTSLRSGYINWASAAAARGNEGEVERLRARAVAIQKDFVNRYEASEFHRVLNQAQFESRHRQVDFERLDWAAMKQNALQVIDRLKRLDGADGEGRRQLNAALKLAHGDLMRAEFELGDDIAARRALEAWSPPTTVQPRTADIQQRFERLRDLLLRIHVLARAGETDFARTELARIWPEVDDVFAAGPEYVFNQAQMAWALSIRAEIEGTPEEKRAWLEPAAGYLRPAAAAGKLRRYERDVLLAEIEKQLAALNRANAP